MANHQIIKPRGLDCTAPDCAGGTIKSPGRKILRFRRKGVAPAALVRFSVGCARGCRNRYSGQSSHWSRGMWPACAGRLLRILLLASPPPCGQQKTPQKLGLLGLPSVKHGINFRQQNLNVCIISFLHDKTP